MNAGALTQISRLGMPLVNEVVIGLPDKDRFSPASRKTMRQFLTLRHESALPS